MSRSLVLLCLFLLMASACAQRWRRPSHRSYEGEAGGSNGANWPGSSGSGSGNEWPGAGSGTGGSGQWPGSAGNGGSDTPAQRPTHIPKNVVSQSRTEWQLKEMGNQLRLLSEAIARGWQDVQSQESYERLDAALQQAEQLRKQLNKLGKKAVNQLGKGINRLDNLQ